MKKLLVLLALFSFVSASAAAYPRRSTKAGIANPRPLSITIGGGVSLGSYQAGLLYYSLRHLKNLQALNLQVVTGTSAGSINGLISIVEACGKMATGPQSSLFYETWIPIGLHRLIVPKRMTATTALANDSFLKTTEIIREHWMKGFDAGCDVLFGISVTRKEPINEEIRPGLVAKKHHEAFVVRIRGRGYGLPPAIENVADPSTSRVLLPLTLDHETNFDKLANLIRASSAIPLAFSRQQIAHCIVPVGDATTYCDPSKAVQDEFLDGGFYDNAPIRLAHRLATLKFHHGPEQERVIYAIASVDNTAYPDPVITRGKDKGILEMVGKLVGDFVSTARSREMSSAFEEVPLLRRSVLTNPKQIPLASEHLSEFLGFFEGDFRRYDFYLGMFDGRYTISKGLMAQGIKTRLEKIKLPYPEEVFSKDMEWKPFFCLECFLDPSTDPVRRAFASKNCHEYAATLGPGSNNFRSLLQTSANLLYSHCQRTEPSNELAHPLCSSIKLRAGVPPMIAQDFDASDWKLRPGEPDFQYFMRKLGDYHFEFKDLGLPPRQAHWGMARLERKLAELVDAIASLQPVGEGALVRAGGYFAVHSLTQRTNPLGFLMGVNTMATTFILILGAALLLMVLERLFPARPLPAVDGWWGRVVIINILQAGVVIAGGYTWERWMMGKSLFSLTESWGVAGSAAFGYFVITFVYYWWHRVRHDNHFLWLSMHQIHHSPQRIETVTSFYKHPLEIFTNSILISAVLYPLLGLTAVAGAWVTVLTCYAEYFYHMNLKTPRWAGFFLQRPEMHRYHHEFGKHYGNFADLPVWDMIFGTYFNPRREEDTECGFEPEREARFYHMLFFKDVHVTVKPVHTKPSEEVSIVR